MNNPIFNSRTFQYFDNASKNKNNAKWFEKNKSNYDDNVKAPFVFLVEEIKNHLQSELPRIEINPRSITRPLRPKNRASEGGGLVRSSSHTSIAEKKSSLFEWNPGLYIQIGAGKEDCFVGLGLYMISSRQMSLLRNALFEDFGEIDAILSDRKLKKVWGGVLGERYKRFPKGFDAAHPHSKYIWHKQFYLGQRLTRAEVKSEKFVKEVVQDYQVAMPFYQWVRGAVGVYRRS